MKIVFLGNTSFSLIGAKIIHEKLGLTAIVTIEGSRNKKGNLIESPLKVFAAEKNIPCLIVNKIDEDKINQIAAYEPDFLIVEDYGLILPKKLLELPRYAPLNIHHSMLPKYRGPAPAPYAILSGEKISGVSVIHMNNKVDSGDIYSQKEYILKPNETTESLLTVLNEYGGNLAVEVINNILNGTAKPTVQDENKVILTYFMKKSDGFIDVENLPEKNIIDRRIRAYYPWPNVWTKVSVHNKEVRIIFLPDKIIQMEGKKPVSKKDFLNGFPELTEIINKII